ncbi:hypothetical protein [Hydrogenivirga sp.]
MFRLLIPLALLVISLGFGVLAPLGLRLGEATLDDLKSKFGDALTYIGKEDYTGYETYRVGGGHIDLEGVVEMKAVVSPEGRLVAVELTFLRGKEDVILDNVLYILSQKYRLLFKETPEKGTWYLEFADGESRVSLIREHRSPVFTVLYASPEYLKPFSDERERRRRELEKRLRERL